MKIATPLSPPWTDRIHPQAAEDPARRSEFQLDRDRVLHSRSFRRLLHKTQVFVVTEADFFRTRITHSLEVAQVGRGIAYELGLNADLAEAIALAHDLGHGPFGHAGESVLNDLLSDHGGWNANEHSLEVVDEHESPYPEFRGLNLTRATREGLALHATDFDEPAKSTEFKELPQGGPESQIISEADESAFVAHDVEDSVNGGLLRLDEIKSDGPTLWREAINRAEERCATNPRADLIRDRDRVVLRRATSWVIGSLIENIVRSSRDRISASRITSNDQIRNQSNVICCASPEMTRYRKEINQYMTDRVYRHPSILRQTQRGQMVLTALFERFANEPSLMPLSTQEKLKLPGASTERVVATFLAGMTDRFALDTYSEIFEPLSRSFGGRHD